MHISNAQTSQYAPPATKLAVARSEEIRALSTGTRASIDAPTGGGLEAVPEPIDIDEFMRAWGTADERFDFNGDGRVDGTDLTEALSRNDALLLENQPVLTEAPDPVVTTTAATTLSDELDPTDPPEAERSDSDTVLKTWGTDAPEGDLDGNGVVDGRDLALALGGGAASAEADTDGGDWGTDAPVGRIDGDLDGNGVVDGRDLAMQLGGMTGTEKHAMSELKSLLADWSASGEVADRLAFTGAPDPFATSRPGETPTDDPFRLDDASLDRATKSVVARLEELGFTKAPPSNLHDVLGKLGYEGSIAKQLAASIATHFGGSANASFLNRLA